MKRPFFSIIVPTYNSATVLAGCLDSVLNQSFLDFEIIIQDGSSSDTTMEIIKCYAASYSTIQWSSEKDDGIYDAMNKGLRLVNGEWICFLGSDDRFHTPDVLEDLTKEIQTGYDVVYGNVRVNGDAAWAKDGTIFNGKYDVRKLLATNICQQAMFYNRVCFSYRVPAFVKEYRTCADWDFNLFCWSRKPFFYVDMILVDFFGGGTSSLKPRDEKFRSDFRKNCLKYFGVDFMNQNEAANKNEENLVRPAKNKSRWFDKLFRSHNSWK